MDKIDEIAKLLKEQNRLIKTMTAELQLNNDLMYAKMKKKSYLNNKNAEIDSTSIVRKYENLRKNKDRIQ